jgi:mannose-6-phosphate isomerase-like protein (cupin superfamily)
MKLKDKKYNNCKVIKPWGSEYVIYRDRNKICITLLKIKFNNSTSLHCHPNKKTGFMLLKGKALFQLGLWKKKSEIHSSPSKRMIARGLFHSIKSISKEGLTALEFETPVDKNDLVRFKDNYGRSKKKYEGSKFMQSLDKNAIKLSNLLKLKKQTLCIEGKKVFIEHHFNFKKLIKNKKGVIFGIIKGLVVDDRSKKVLEPSDIVKTEDFKALSKVFKIKSNLCVMRLNNI